MLRARCLSISGSASEGQVYLSAWLVMFNDANATAREMACLRHAAPRQSLQASSKPPKSIHLPSFTPKLKASGAPACRSRAGSQAVLFGKRGGCRFPETCPSFREVAAAETCRVAAALRSASLRGR